MAHPPQLRIVPPTENVAGDSLISPDCAVFSPARHVLPKSARRRPPVASSSSPAHNGSNNRGAVDLYDPPEPRLPHNLNAPSENTPLLDNGSKRSKRKPFYRARPLWLLPFAIISALVRGMTMAPRVEVFTQLSCNQLYGRHHAQQNDFLQATWQNGTRRLVHEPPFSTSGLYLGPSAPAPSTSIAEDDPSDPTSDPRRLPSQQCLSDPAVQAGAARLQTIMTTTMGLLSALTTGWWGRFGERHGRTRVLASATAGLFFTDLIFILVATPTSFLANHPHAHKFLFVAPIIEGLLGGWSTLQSATSAYLSDCTSPGSRAYIFSRFTGVFYLGFSVGPSIGGYLIKHPLTSVFGGPTPINGDSSSVTSAFWVAVVFSFINLMLVLFAFPESLGKQKRERMALALDSAAGKGKAKAFVPSTDLSDLEEEDEEEAQEQVPSARVDLKQQPFSAGSPAEPQKGIVMSFLSPLAVFLPVVVLDPYGLGRKKRDWSLTLLAGALFGLMLSTGVVQVKYLYAVHIYGWGAEKLGYYISFTGAARALFLLFLLPPIIRCFKPKPQSNSQASKSKKGQGTPNKSTGKASSKSQQSQQVAIPGVKKPKPNRTQLGAEIGFDLILTRCSLIIDIVSHTLVAIIPTPAYKAHIERFQALKKDTKRPMSFAQSQASFVVASSLNSLGSGSVPAIHSLALCVLQVRAMDAKIAKATSAEEEEAIRNGSAEEGEEEGTGSLFGALAVLQAVGQMIIGPMLFGLIYSETVALYPKAIFTVAVGILLCALAMVLSVQNPVQPVYPGRGKGRHPKHFRGLRDVERGRSRVSKDLRGGAVGYYRSQSYASNAGSSWGGSDVTATSAN